jgi:hypothetical protein
MEIELHEEIRTNQTVNRKLVLDIIKDNFNDVHTQLKIRSKEEQLIIGNLITVLEMNIKNEVKQLNN